jgi:hypothetical protein
VARGGRGAQPAGEHWARGGVHTALMLGVYVYTYLCKCNTRTTYINSLNLVPLFLKNLEILSIDTGSKSASMASVPGLRVSTQIDKIFGNLN